MTELSVTRAAQLLASRQNRKYFLENFYQIPIVGKGASPFILRPYQDTVCDVLDTARNVVGVKARQIGWTTIGVAYAFHDALFNEEHPWLFVSATEDKAFKMLDKAKYALTRLPGWMKKELPSWNMTQSVITFDNGSRIESVPATPSTGRTDSVYGALMDEAAFMEYAPEIWAAIEPNGRDCSSPGQSSLNGIKAGMIPQNGYTEAVNGSFSKNIPLLPKRRSPSQDEPLSLWIWSNPATSRWNLNCA
jgi:hypothetical protein